MNGTIIKTSLSVNLRKLYFLLTLLVIILSACQSTPVASPTPNTSEQWLAWQTSVHADTYDLGKGPNTYCARCHSPLNWDPQAKIDSPPNCVSCKFPSETGPRIAVSNRLVPETDWKDIGCDICHPKKDPTYALAWLNVETKEYESVPNPSALCVKCHTDTDTLRHARVIGDQAHVDYECTDCHDPHSLETDCEAIDCHPGTFRQGTTTVGHDETHRNVTCIACHDALNLEVRFDEEKGIWITYRKMELLGQIEYKPYQSHYLQRKSECEKCHFLDNPWNLKSPVDINSK